MNKYLVSLLIITMLFFQLNNNVLMVRCSEQDNIDGFEVHPENRWDNELSEAGTTELISFQKFWFTDFDGDTGESTLYTRPLSKRDGKISARVYTPFHDTAGGSIVKSYFGIHNISDDMTDTDDMQAGFYFQLNDTTFSDSTADLYCFYLRGTVTGKYVRSIYMGTFDESIYIRLELAFDLLKAELSFSVEYDNGTEVAEYDYTDFASGLLDPRIFQNSGLKVCFGHYFDSVPISSELLTAYDFINAPYEEFQFKFQSAPSDIIPTNPDDLVSYNEYGMDLINPQTVDTITATYYYTIPDFDSVSGILYASTNATSETSIDETACYVIGALGVVSPNNGTIKSIITVMLGYSNYNETWGIDGTFTDPRVRIWVDKTVIETPDLIKQIDSSEFENSVECGFSFYISPNKIVICQVTFSGLTYSYSFDASSYSSEFVFAAVYHLVRNTDIDTQQQTYHIGLKDFEPVYRNLFGFLPDIPNPLDVVNDIASGGVDLVGSTLMQGFRFLGGIFAPIIEFFEPIITLITTIIGSIAIIQTAIDTIDGVVDTISTGIGSLATDIWNDFSTVLGDISGYVDDLEGWLDSIDTLIGDLAGDIWTSIIAQITAIFDEIITWISGAIDDVVAVLWLAWDLIVANTFIGDLIAPLGYIYDIFMQLVGGYNIVLLLFLDIITFAIEYAFFLYLIFTFILFLAIVVPSDLFRNMCIDVTRGSSVFGMGFYIPMGVVWLVLTIFWWATYN